MPAATILYSLISGIVGGLIVAAFNHWLTRKHENEKNCFDLNIEYLIDRWIKIEHASLMSQHVSLEIRACRLDDLEHAIARIFLIRNSKELDAAKAFAKSLAADTNSLVNKLLDSLRDSLCERLELEPVGRLDLFLSMRRDLQ
jgi:hypothetical protein